MQRRWGHFLFILLVVGGCGAAWWAKGVHKGIDLNGGAELRYGIDVREIEEERRRLRICINRARDLETRAAMEEELKLKQKALEKEPSPEKQRELRDQIEDLRRDLDIEALEAHYRKLGYKADISKAVDIVRRRVDPQAYKGATVAKLGENRIMIQVPYEPEEGLERLLFKGYFDECVDGEEVGREARAAAPEGWDVEVKPSGKSLPGREGHSDAFDFYVPKDATESAVETFQARLAERLGEKLRSKHPFTRLRTASEIAFYEKVKSIKRIVARQGVLKFHLVVDDREKEDEADQNIKELAPPPRNHLVALPHDEYREFVERAGNERKQVPRGYIRWPPPRPVEPGGPETAEKQARLLLKDRAALEGTDIVDYAYTGFGAKGPEVLMDFTPGGSRAFGEVTGKNVGRRLAIVLDNIIQSAPVVQEKITRSGRITGNFTLEEADELATVLSAGSLPIQVGFESEFSVGPSLGQDSIEKGVFSIALGGLCVFAFMTVYYLTGGVVACIAVTMNMIMTVGALALYNAFLTLPGMAGLLLTVGMAVDANVLIFERIREEKAKGKTLRLAVQAGYDRAFVTIIDANVTTIITGLVLYYFGMGPIKGFAVTLVLGTIANLFTAVYASRVLVDWLVASGIVTEFAMFQLVKKPALPFVRLRWLGFVFSIVLVGASLWQFSTHEGKYGIDFLGGVRIRLNFVEPIDDDVVRAAAEEAVREISKDREKPIGAPRVQAVEAPPGLPPGHSTRFTVTITKDISPEKEHFTDLLKKKLAGSLDRDEPVGKTEAIGEAVSRDLKSAAFMSIFVSLALIFMYIVVRFEFNPGYGLGAVVALAHDVAITLGAIVLMDKSGLMEVKIDLPIVGALLAIIGYSLNDTIVLFDRIREDRHIFPKKTYGEVVNLSINETLARTALTSLTTLLAVGALLIFGGGVVRGFAYAMMVGVLVGTYSSIFVASQVVVQWARWRGKGR